MAESNGAGPERSGKPPAITVRADNWDDYDWITQASVKRGESRGEFLLLSALQRRHGGAVPKGRKAKAAAAKTGANVHTSAEAKADVQPRPKGAKPTTRRA